VKARTFIVVVKMNKYHKTLFPEGWEIFTAKTLAEVESFRPLWEKLQNEETFPVPNADIDRYITIIEPLQESVQPHIILLRHNGQTEAMVIGRVEMTKLNCRIGYKTLLRPTLKCLTIVYGGLVGKFTDDALCVLLQELLRTLSKKEVDVVLFNQLRTDSSAYQLVRTKPGFFCRDHFSVVDPHWQTKLLSKEMFFTATRRRYLKRYIKDLEKVYGEPIEVVCYRSPNDITRIINEVSEISKMTYKHAMNVGFKDDLKTKSILELAAKQGRLRAYVLYAAHRPLAFECGIEYNQVFFPEYNGYDPEARSCSPGTVLFLKVLEDLMGNTAIRIFDYGSGEAIYKERFGTDSWPESTVYIFAPRLYPILVNILQSSVTGLSLTLEYILNRTGLVGWIKRSWRKKLETKEPKIV
jgi:hypothetical protein